MSKQLAGILFPHQLFEDNPLLQRVSRVYLLEEYLFFRHFPFHKGKLAYHRSSMKFYCDYLRNKGVQVRYIETSDSLSDIREFIPFLGKNGVREILYIDPVDDWLSTRLKEAAEDADLILHELDSPMFLNSKEELSGYFEKKKRLRQTDFYIKQRKKRDILVDELSHPLEGKWTFDTENRSRYPAKRVPPVFHYPAPNSYSREAASYVDTHFPENPGKLTDSYRYPITFDETRQWIDQFLNERFEAFGRYQDAMLATGSNLHHSIISPMMNSGLITPDQLIRSVLSFSREHKVPISSLEGFIRQVLGWREFLRGVYQFRGRFQRSRNYWGFNRPMPTTFWDGTTGIEPVDGVIRKTLDTGYAHHIERLMVLGNFMLLCEISPDQVYHWFMSLYIDAYDWVMVPNVYGMSQYADGGLMSTKPYFSSSNYLRKMSDYKSGDWEEVWDGLFWRFMDLHRAELGKNPRLRMLIATYDKMAPERRSSHLENARNYLQLLPES